MLTSVILDFCSYFISDCLGRLADEWYVAIREITRACMGTTFAPSEIVHRFHSAIQLATLAAERYHIAGTHTRLQIFDAPALSAVASKAHEPSYPNEHKKLFTQNLCRTAAASQEFQNRPPPILGADDILPIVTWLLIQSNPTNVETIIWYCSEFRHPALAFGHANYSLAQISSALEFVKTAGPAELSSYPTLPDQIRSLSNYLQRHQNTQQLIENCKLGSNEDCLQQLISNGGADLDGYSLDKCDTPLSGAVRFRQHKVVSFLLNLALKDSNDCISTSGGFKFIDIDKPLNPAYAGEPPFCYTALHLAVRVGDINTVILLLNAGANRYSCDSEGNSPLLLAIKYNHSEIQKILVSDPLLCSLVPEIFRGSVATVYGLIKQKQFSCTSNAMQECSPIAASVLSLNECILSILIGQVYDDNNNKAFDINAVNGNGETALMLCGSRKKEGLLVNLTDKGSCKEHSNGIIQYYDEIISNASLEYESEDYRRMKLAVRLIQAGAVAGVVDSRGLIAFVHCLLNGFVDIDSGFSCTTLDENCEVTDETAEEGASILSIPKSTATETASSLILSSRNILQNKCDIDKISLTCAALVKRIDSAQENCKAEQANTWCRYPRLTAVMLYSPRTHKIYQCARDKCYHAVRALLDHGEDPNLRCPVEDYTALLASVQNSSIMIFNALLADARTDLNFPRVLSNNMTALHFAASTGNTNMVGCLLWAGANRLAVTLDNKRAIDYAIEAGHKESADVLNFDPDKVSISLAAKHGDIRVTKALLAQGVSINTMRRHFVDKLIKHHLFTPLLAATAYGQIEYINFLLAYSEANGVYMQMQSLENSLLKSELLEINAANLEAHTALMVAAMVGHEEILLLLLNRGKANRYLVDMNGATAADWAKLRGFDSIFDILRYDPSRCSIHAFVSNGNLGACVALFKQRVDPNEPYISGSQNKIDQSAAAVSMAGVIEGETPLAIAARKNHLPIMRLLLQAPGILTDSRDTDGVTPLGRASEAGNEAAVLLLLKHGCSRSHSDFRGRRPVDLALSKGHIEIAALLEVDPLHANCYNLCAEGRVCEHGKFLFVIFHMTSNTYR